MLVSMPYLFYGDGTVYKLGNMTIFEPAKEARNQFPAWRAGTAALFFVQARQATQAGGIDSWAP
jgi:hypothetical protein